MPKEKAKPAAVPTKGKAVAEREAKGPAARAGAATDNGREDGALRGALAKLRPRRRIGFFVAFSVGCIWFHIFFNPCDVKKKKDCDGQRVRFGSRNTRRCR